MKARAVKSFPIGKEWMYEPKWDGFRCLVFRDQDNIFLQSRTGKSLTSTFPEIVAAFRGLGPKRFFLDGELALPTEDGFSFDGLVNRLRIGRARYAQRGRMGPRGPVTGRRNVGRYDDRYDGPVGHADAADLCQN
jgi:ATP-dependent DNA ligase